MAHGKYVIGAKQQFLITPTGEQFSLNEELKQKWPFANFCIYNGSVISPLQQVIIDAAKAAYLATLIEIGGENVERFTGAQLSGDLLIKPVLTSKQNKLRIGLPEAYFYWAKTSQLMK